MHNLTQFQYELILIALSFFAGASAMFAAFCHFVYLQEVAKQIAADKARHPSSRMELAADQDAIAQALGVMHPVNPK